MEKLCKELSRIRYHCLRDMRMAIAANQLVVIREGAGVVRKETFA